jgi:hypothetical protein
VYDAGEAIQLAIRLRGRFDTPANMLAALDSRDLYLSEDAATVIGSLALNPNPEAVAWLVVIAYTAGRIDRPESHARKYQLYSALDARNRSAI